MGNDQAAFCGEMMTNPLPTDLAPTVPPPPAMLPHELPAEERANRAAKEIEAVLQKYNVTLRPFVKWYNDDRPMAQIETVVNG